MKRIILPYSRIANPLGFPGEYPAETRLIPDKDPVPDGWEVVTDEEYKRRIETNYATVAALNAASEVAENVAKETKQVEVEGYYAELKTLRKKLDGAEKLSEADLTAILQRLIDILLAKEHVKS